MAETPNLLDWILKKLRELKAPTEAKPESILPYGLKQVIEDIQEELQRL